MQFRSKDHNNSEEEEAKEDRREEEAKNNGYEQEDKEGNKATMDKEQYDVGYQQEDDRSGELMVTIPVTMPLCQFNQMQVQQSDDISEGLAPYMIDIPEEVKLELQGVLQNSVATEKMKTEVKYLLSKPQFTVNELWLVVETIHDLSAEMQENVHIDYSRTENNEAASMEMSLDYDILWSTWENMKEKCTPEDVMQNWSKAVMKKILNESIEYILEDQLTSKYKEIRKSGVKQQER